MFGLGGYAANFIQGTQDRSRELMGRRQAAALAFQEFKAQNPTATYGDFQQFVDSMSNGSNYLRGAMPARDVLEQLGKQNEANRRAEATQRQTMALLSQQQQMAAIRGGIDAARRAGVRDPLKITEGIAQQLGIDKTQDAAGYLQLEETLRGINPTAVIDELDRTDFLSGLELATKSINAGLFDSEDALGDIIPSHLRGTPYEERFRNQVSGAFSNFQGQRREAVFNAALDMASNLSKMGASEADIGPLVQEVYGKMYPNAPIDLKLISGITKDIIKRINDDRNIIDDEKRRADIQKFNDWSRSDAVLSILQNSPENADRLLTEEARLFFGDDVTDVEIRGIVEAAKRSGNMFIDDRQTNQYREIEAQAPTIISKAREANAEAIRPILKEAPPAAAAAINTILAQGLTIEPEAITAMIEAASTGNAEDMTPTQLSQYLAKEFGQYISDPGQEMEIQLQSSKPETREARLTSAGREMESAIKQVVVTDFRAAMAQKDLAARMDALSGVLQDARSLMLDAEAMIEEADSDFGQPWALSSSRLSPTAYRDGLRTLGKANKQNLARFVAAIEREIASLRVGGGRSITPGGSSQQPSQRLAPTGRPATSGRGAVEAGITTIPLPQIRFKTREELAGPDPRRPRTPQERMLPSDAAASLLGQRPDR